LPSGEESFARRVEDKTKEEKLFFALFFYLASFGSSVEEEVKGR